MTVFKGWEKVPLKIENGETVQATAPVIISASRETDIPAFYSDWFMNRLKAGYSKWINPFNSKAQYISFRNARIVVFWTKNPEPMIECLEELDGMNLNYYFTFTLNDYEKEDLEPGLPPLEKRIEIFKKLSKKIGKEKVVWRFDPLILGENISTEDLLEKIKNIGDRLHGYTEKLVVSFADIHAYGKVEKNIGEFGNYREFTPTDVERIASGLSELNERWNLEIATCAETIDLERYGIQHNKCIDDDLMIRLFKSDEILMDFLGYSQQAMFPTYNLPNLKDKGQRKACGCIVSKDIGQYNTCGHLCRYCYANFSEKIVRENIQKHLNNAESIVECR